MQLLPATIKLSHDQLVQIVFDFLKRQGFQAESVAFSSYEVGHNGPTRYEATASIGFPVASIGTINATPADAP